MANIDAKKLLDLLTTDNIKQIMKELNSNYRIENDEHITFQSVCHKSTSYKLYYYKSSKSFYCFKESERFSLYNLIMRVLHIGFLEALEWTCRTCGIEYTQATRKTPRNENIDNWQESLSKYIKYQNKEVELQIYDHSILGFFPKIYHQSWIDDNITIETMQKYQIAYYPYQDCIIIPCFDEYFNLIGIRGRFLNPNAYSRYMPIELLDGTSFKFPTNQVMYGIQFNKQAIIRHKKIIILESEKAVMQLDGMYGDENISVAIYGSNIGTKRRDDILKLGVEAVYLGLDFDYKTYGDEEYDLYEQKVLKQAGLFKGYCEVFVLCSHGGHIYKASPTDMGKEFFEKLMREREIVE